MSAKLKPIHISGEERYILDCLACELFNTSPLPNLPNGLDWGRLYRLLRSHRLAEFFSELGERRGAGWDAAFREKIKRDRYSLKLYGDQLWARVDATLSALNRAGIRVIVLKGWAHILTVYGGDCSLRQTSDLDIFIHPRDANAADRALNEAGWVAEPESWEGYALQYANGRKYIHAARGGSLADDFSIGLKWGLIRIPTYDSKQVDAEELLGRATPLKLGGEAALELDIRDQIIYTCAHLGLHHYYDPALFRYFELATLIRNGGVLDWEEIAQISQRWRCVLPVQFCVRQLFELFAGKVVTEEVLLRIESLEAGRLERFTAMWQGRFRSRRLFAEHVLNWLTFPRRTERIVIMFKDIFPSRAYMRRRYGGWWLLSYFKRFTRSLSILSRGTPDT